MLDKASRSGHMELFSHLSTLIQEKKAMNTVYPNRWMELKEDDNGEAFVTMQNDAVMIVAVTKDNKLFFIEEKSIAYQIPTLTLPAGMIEKNELPEITADRELQKEVGYQAEKLTYIGTLHPSIKYVQWQCHIYVAQNLMRAELDEDETSLVKLKMIDMNEFDKWVISKQITDTTTIASVYLTRQYLLT